MFLVPFHKNFLRTLWYGFYWTPLGADAGWRRVSVKQRRIFYHLLKQSFLKEMMNADYLLRK